MKQGIVKLKFVFLFIFLGKKRTNCFTTVLFKQKIDK